MYEQPAKTISTSYDARYGDQPDEKYPMRRKYEQLLGAEFTKGSRNTDVDSKPVQNLYKKLYTTFDEKFNYSRFVRQLKLLSRSRTRVYFIYSLDSSR